MALPVTIDELLSDFTRTDTYRDRYVPGGTYDTHEGFHIHTLTVAVECFVRTAVWRNGRFHPVIVAPVSTVCCNDVNEQRELRKHVTGDETRDDMGTATTGLLTSSFEDIASGKSVDETPWPVKSWSDKEKTSVNAAFAKAMGGPLTPEKRPPEGLDGTPKHELKPELDKECGKADPSWRDFWNAEFIRRGWRSRSRA